MVFDKLPYLGVENYEAYGYDIILSPTWMEPPLGGGFFKSDMVDKEEGKF